MKKLLLGLTLLTSMSSFAIEVDDYLRDVNKAAALLTKIASKTSVARCEVEANKANSGGEEEVHASRSECNSGRQGTYAEDAKICADKRAKQVCKAKGLKECDSTEASTTYHYRYYSGSKCLAISSLTVQK